MQVQISVGSHFHACAEPSSGPTVRQKAQTPAETLGDELQVPPVTTCPHCALSL